MGYLGYIIWVIYGSFIKINIVKNSILSFSWSKNTSGKNTLKKKRLSKEMSVNIGRHFGVFGFFSCYGSSPYNNLNICNCRGFVIRR